MKDTAVVFVTDSGYLAPSLLAAEQVLAQGLGRTADVLIYTIDVDETLAERLEAEVADPALRILPLRSRNFIPPAGTPFFSNHVPVTSLARLALEPELPTQYRRLIYLDGDIQVVGEIAPLVEHRVPEGRILAGRGSSWLDPQGRIGMESPGYLEALGGVRKQDYFNAGVLAFTRDTWAEYAPRALQLFIDNAAVFERHDQSALNAAFKGQADYFSPAYNFHSFYASCYAHTFMQPRIIHFTGAWKPWKSVGAPWGNQFLASYHGLLDRHPGLRDVFTVRHYGAADRAGAPLRWAREVTRLARDRHVLSERRALVRDYVREGPLVIH